MVRARRVPTFHSQDETDPRLQDDEVCNVVPVNLAANFLCHGMRIGRLP